MTPSDPPEYSGPIRGTLNLQMRIFAECGDAAQWRVGPPGEGREFVGFYGPDAFAHILDSPTNVNYRKDSRYYDEIAELFGNGLLVAQDDTWARQRRLVQPLFTARAVDSYARTMTAETRRFVESWRTRGECDLDVGDEMSSLALRIVVRVLVGEDADALVPVVRQAFPSLAHAMLARSARPTASLLDRQNTDDRPVIAARTAVYDMCDQIIARRRGGADIGDDLVGRLLSSRDDHGDGLSDSEIRDQVLIFLLAGHDTTATALTFTLWLLGHHRAEQDRVRAEVAELGGEPTAADLRDLTYTTMVLREAMRLYPSAPAITRLAVADDTVCGYRVRRGQTIVWVPWVMHRRADIWPDPLRFDPLRFERDRVTERHRLAWMPFGHGPRACIGQRFAMLESLAVMAGIFAAFDIRSEPIEPRVASDIALRLREPLHISVS